MNHKSYNSAEIIKEEKYVFGMALAEAKYCSSRFRFFLEKSLTLEGVNITHIYFKLKDFGYANDINDAGKATIFGIASRYHPEEYESIMQSLFMHEYALAFKAVIRFYYKNFYNPLYDEIQNELLAYRIFDFGINAKPSRSVKLLQKSFNLCYKYPELKIDGVFGERTLAAINKKKDDLSFYTYYVRSIAEWYSSRKTFWKFGKGWLNRLRQTFVRPK